ncbi:MAG TPA: isoprenyl transferase [Phycisphaerales bacterium]|nr:isoprenyl transferase [Phycisphaerales bacterium]HMP36626.1 isoprenyl transferase [Phycisphaerales bacterium]
MPETIAKPVEAPSGLERERLPRHVAIIMDGNGRWAARRGLPRLLGHRAGARTVRDVVTESAKLGIEALTLYSFSSENWKRPADEIDGLMALCQEHLVAERDELIANGIRFRTIGRLEGLPPAVQGELRRTAEATRACAGTTLVLALNYGGRAEIVDAMRRIARRVASGEIGPEAIDEAMIDAHLDTAGLPDPDLLIRTAGEMRLSNYLLWQISYAELHVTDVLWPDFGVDDYHAALRSFAARSRRFGGLNPA